MGHFLRRLKYNFTVIIIIHLPNGSRPADQSVLENVAADSRKYATKSVIGLNEGKYIIKCILSGMLHCSNCECLV